MSPVLGTAPGTASAPTVAPLDDDRLRAASAWLSAELDAEDMADAHAMLDPPTPLIRPMPPPAPYPMDALGPILAPSARAIAEIVQVPDALAANSVLAAAALAAQSHADVQTLGGPRPLSLFILTIAQSGDRKTAADNVALRPVREHTKALHEKYSTDLLSWEREQEAHKFERAKKRKDAETGDAYADALKNLAPTPKPRAPWLICSEPTAEGLMRSLADGQYGQGIYTDEGGQFLGGHAMSEDAELRSIAMLSKAWQGAPLDRVRATDREHIILYGRRLCMHLLVQPDVANRMLGKPLYRSQGFLARWLIAAPDSLAGTRLHDPGRPDPCDDPRIGKFWSAVTALLSRPATVDDELGGLNPPVLALSPEARALLVAAYNETEAAQSRDGELVAIREWASKSAEQACRIAGTLTLIADPDSIHVTVEAMRGALTVMQFHMGEYFRLIGSADVPEHILRAARLLEWLREKGLREIKPSKVMQYGPGAIRHGTAAKEALRTLADHGWLSTHDGKTYRAHPATFA